MSAMWGAEPANPRYGCPGMRSQTLKFRLRRSLYLDVLRRDTEQLLDNVKRLLQLPKPRERSAQRRAVQWLPDALSTSCACCHAKFSLTLRKRHCRTCGKIVCGSCLASYGHGQACVLLLSCVCCRHLLDRVDRMAAIARGRSHPVLELYVQ